MQRVPEQVAELEIDERDLVRVPMFPLPNVVLLPGTLLPLHIFEPRYRDMTRDVLSGSGLIALARLQDGYEAEYEGRPPVHSTIGVGRVIASDQLADGRYYILVRGLIRASVAEEHAPERAYREVRATPLMDTPPRDPALAIATHQKLVALCDQLSTLIEQGGADLRELVRSDASPGGCADMVSAALLPDPDERQRLLETCDPLERLEHVIGYVGRIIIEVGPAPDPSLMN